MTDYESLGSRIRRLRRMAGLSQEALARPDLSPSYVSLLEADKRVPSMEVIAQLAERLGCEASYLSGSLAKHDTVDLELELRYAQLALRNGDAEAALTGFTELRNRLSAAEHYDLLFSVDLGIAQCLEHKGNLEDAALRYETLHRQRVAEGRGAVDQLGLVMSLCRCYRELGNLSHAIGVAEKALAEANDLPPSVEYLELLSTLIGIYTERGDLHRAGFLASQAIGRAAIVTDRRALGGAYWNASVILHRQGRSNEALTLITKAVAIYAEGDDERALARVRNAYATVLLQTEDANPEAAKALLEQSAVTLRAVGSSIDVAYVETAIGRADVMLGQPESAIQHAERALDLLGPEHRLESARVQLVLAAAHLLRGDHEAVQTAYERGALLLEASEAGRQAAFAWSELAEILEKCGESERAVWAYRQGMRLMGHRSSLISVARPDLERN
ncbi:MULTISPECIES: helix-turn-helix domain-containing protein [unclassified Streptomyces]|uniref:helix-turn-helix domain-containing protein n=1 Tax=unclassified Streptomyces TaxID=2593676 RepID=UPI0029A8F2B3|nr:MULTISPECIES: helix-turn-helix domain-containing protein [unclassified Streptomyces]MDX3771729.1 helix-turn-helix domain-containing protein [Streptomyces sp. AK08-01B]MDX3821319.1 helix-turn-helix domain-containing protein [Streptomyces sp. AK08-01A]